MLPTTRSPTHPQPSPPSHLTLAVSPVGPPPLPTPTPNTREISKWLGDRVKPAVVEDNAALRRELGRISSYSKQVGLGEGASRLIVFLAGGEGAMLP